MTTRYLLSFDYRTLNDLDNKIEDSCLLSANGLNRFIAQLKRWGTIRLGHGNINDEKRQQLETNLLLVDSINLGELALLEFNKELRSQSEPDTDQSLNLWADKRINQGKVLEDEVKGKADNLPDISELRRDNKSNNRRWLGASITLDRKCLDLIAAVITKEGEVVKLDKGLLSRKEVRPDERPEVAVKELGIYFLLGARLAEYRNQNLIAGDIVGSIVLVKCISVYFIFIKGHEIQGKAEKLNQLLAAIFVANRLLLLDGPKTAS